MPAAGASEDKTIPDRAIGVIQDVLPVLSLAKESVTGIPIVEPVLGGVLRLTQMVDTMKSNAEALPELRKSLTELIAHDESQMTGDLHARLKKLKTNLKKLDSECEALAKKSPIRWFVAGDKYKARIEDIKSQIASSIHAFTFEGNISIEKIVNEMMQRVEALDQKIVEVGNKADGIDDNVIGIMATAKGADQKLDRARADEILGRITCAPARFNADHTPDHCTPGTRVDIIATLVQRLTAPVVTSESERIVILSGSAGSGKSTITKSVAIELDERHQLAASFFFSRDSTDRREIMPLVTTLARQLAEFSPEFERILVQFLENDKTQILSAAPDLQFKSLVVELLADLARSVSIDIPWVICLDALDECGALRGQDVLRLLSENMEAIPKHIRFFLTGRPDVPSYLKWDALHSIAHHIILDELDATEDIRKYVRWQLDFTNWRVRGPWARVPWAAQTADIDEITERAGGLFIFAATAVRYVVPDRADDDPGDSINFLLRLNARLDGLHTLYYRIVDHAIGTSELEDSRAQSKRDRALAVLSTILNLREPMGPHSLAMLLAITVDELRRSLHLLSAVIRVPEDDNGEIRIIHLSFREFMTTVVGKMRPDLLCGTQDQHHALALHILRVLHDGLGFNICKLPSSYLRNSEVSDLQLRLDNFVPTHLRYSCRFWADHITKTSFNEQSLRIAQSFLLEKFLFWLEVLSLLGMMSSARHTLTSFIAWAPGKPAVIDFAVDAKHFIAFFAEAMIQSAPHIYLSALALAPVTSDIGRRFRPHFPRLVSVSRGQLEQWPAELANLEGHRAWIRSVCFSPNGNFIASGDENGVVRVWDAESGENVGNPLVDSSLKVKKRANRRYGGQRTPAWVTCVALSSGSLYVAAGYEEGSARVWDVANMHLIAKLRITEAEGIGMWMNWRPIYSAAFSLDGKQVAFVDSESGRVSIWDVQTGLRLIRSLAENARPEQWASAVAYSASHIACGFSDGTVQLWNSETAEAVGPPIHGHKLGVTSVVFSSDGKHLSSTSTDGSALMCDVVTSQVIRGPFFPPGKFPASTPPSAPDSKGTWRPSHFPGMPVSSAGRLITARFDLPGDHSLQLWDAEHGLPIGQPLQGHSDEIMVANFSLDGTRIVSGSRDHTVRVWNTLNLNVDSKEDHFDSPTGRITNVAFSVNEDGKHKVYPYDSSIRWLHSESHQANSGPIPLPIVGEKILSRSFSQDGRLAVGKIDHEDPELIVWDTKSGGLVLELDDFKSVECVAFSPNKALILTREHDDMTRSSIDAVACSRDGKKIAVASRWARRLSIFHAENDALLAESPVEFYNSRGSLYCNGSLCFSATDAYVAFLSGHQEVLLWDAHTAELKTTFGDGEAYSIAVSPVEALLAAGYFDGTVRVWDMERKVLLWCLEGGKRAHRSLAFSLDGRYLASGSGDKAVRIWDMHRLVSGHLRRRSGEGEEHSTVPA